MPENTPLNPDLLAILACPYEGRELCQSGSWLTCGCGHEFPIIDEVPVLLRRDTPETIGLTSKSITAAEEISSGTRTDRWFVDTLGLSDAEKTELIAALNRAHAAVDPVASYLIAATNGILYKPLVGALNQYPIPEIGLPDGGNRLLLDVGCSWGRWSQAAARKGYRPVGIDPSLGAVLAAMRISRHLGQPFYGVVGDARHLPFRPMSFDAVFSYSVLQHLSRLDTEKVLKEINRVLRDKRVVLIQMASAIGIRSIYQQMRRAFRQPRDFEVRYWNPNTLLLRFREIFGEAELIADCYFGLGLQASDRRFFGRTGSTVIGASEWLKRLSLHVRPLAFLADSVYLRSGF